MSDIQETSGDNPCLSCGACCKTYRVSFYWAEADERGLPAQLTEQVTAFHACMAGTNASHPYCVALQRAPDGAFSCGVYTQRPSPCREVQIGDERCNQARMRHGLAPIHADQAQARPN